MSEDKKIPEWHIFDRIEDLEKNVLEIMCKPVSSDPETTKLLKDSINLGLYLLGAFYVHLGSSGVNTDNVRIVALRIFKLSAMKHIRK